MCKWSSISIFTGFLLAASLVGCSTGGGRYKEVGSGAYSLSVHDGDVYVAGDTWQLAQAPPAPGEGIHSTPNLWKNGIRQILGDENQNSSAFSVFVAGDDVYVGGVEGNDRGYAAIWKNGVCQHVSETAYSTVNSIFVVGNDVYAAGAVTEPPYYPHSLYHPMLWKNGETQYLEDDGSVSGSAYSVFVSGEDVFVAGAFGGNGALWKNGVRQTFEGDDLNCRLHEVFISGNDVYVAGSVLDDDIGYQASIWKNWVRQDISDGKLSEAASVYVSGNDVYVAGTCYDNTDKTGTQASIWKNGVRQALTLGFFSYATSVYVSGDDVYVAGHYDGMNAVIWINGVAMSLSTE